MLTAESYLPIHAQQREILNTIVERARIAALERLYYEGQREVRLALIRVTVGKTRGAARAEVVRILRNEEAEQLQALVDEIEGRIDSADERALKEFRSSLDALDNLAGVQPLRPDREQLERVKTAAAVRRERIQKSVRESMAKFFASLIGNLELKLAGIYSDGREVASVIDSMEKFANDEWWRVERIARTQIAFSYNAARSDAIEVFGNVQEQDIWQRWTELVNDDTGNPMDERVGMDSIVMHGQIAKPGHYFTMPPDRRIDHQWWGQKWLHPPNRPNDRSVLMPWRSRWGIPAWQWVDGARKRMR